MKTVQIRVSAEVRDALMAQYYKLPDPRISIRAWLDAQIKERILR